MVPRMSVTPLNNSTYYHHHRAVDAAVWELTKPTRWWQRILSPPNWKICWGKEEEKEEPSAIQSTGRGSIFLVCSNSYSSGSIHSYTSTEDDSGSYYDEGGDEDSTYDSFVLAPQQRQPIGTRRSGGRPSLPPLVAHRSTMGTPSSAHVRQHHPPLSPLPPPALRPPLPMPPSPLMERRFSHTSRSSNNSCHRRDPAVLPNLQQIVVPGNIPRPPTPTNNIPLDIDPAECMRRVSYLSVDEEGRDDDMIWNLDDTSDEEEEDDDVNDDRYNKKYRSSSPALTLRQEHYYYNSKVATTSTDTPYLEPWMLEWAGGTAAAKQEEVAAPIVDNDEDYDDDGPCYLPTVPVPRGATTLSTQGQEVVYQVGWVVAALSQDSHEQVIERLQTISTTQNGCFSDHLYYVQLLHGGILELISMRSSMTRSTFDLNAAAMNVWPVSEAAGHGLVIRASDSSTLGLLPVHLPSTYLRRSLRRSELLPSKQLNDEDPFSTPKDEDRFHYRRSASSFAPYAQHDAILHARFALDAAVRQTTRRR